MATCSSSRGGGGGDEDDWERRRRFNIADNKRALEAIVKEAKDDMNITEGTKKARGKKSSKKGDPTFYSKGKPSCTRDASSRSKRLDYRKLADDKDEEDEEKEK